MSNGDFLFNLFIQETKEHLDKMIECLLNIKKNNNSTDDIVALFRFVHTIKGSSAAMNYTRTSKLLHLLEDVMQKIRDGNVKMTEKHINVLFNCYDYLENFIAVVSSGEDEQTINMDSLFSGLATLGDIEPSKSVIPAVQAVEKKVQTVSYVFSADEVYQSLKDNDIKNLYLLYVLISTDCPYSDVKRWEIFNDIENNSSVIASIPKKISAEEFRTVGFGTDSLKMFLILNPHMNYETIKNKLSDAFVDIDEIHVEPIEFDPKQGGSIKASNENIRSRLLEFDKTNKTLSFNENVYTQIKTSKKQNTDNLPEKNMENELLKSYVGEIDININNALAILMDLGFDLGSHNLLEDLYRTVLTINELGGYIKNDMIFDISNEVTNLMELCLKNKKIFDKQIMSMVYETVELLKKVNITDIVNNKEVSNEIASQISLLKENANMMNGNSNKSQNASVLLDEKPAQIINKSDVKNDTNPLIENKANLHDNKSQVFIRIPEQKVDNLVDMMGELIILQSLIKENIINNGRHCKEDNKVDSLVNKMERMERIIKNLQSTSMSFRMVSLKAAFQKVLRVGMETAKELNKDINFEIIGDETEIDRSVVEKINDPLLHLIRNAVSHGIEDGEHRTINGKSPTGKIQIKAYNRKGNVNIEICDDGFGLDLDGILKKAISKKLAVEGKQYTENGIISFIFLDGISTQKNVNSISGRGIGMNVVESEIKKLGGRIEVKNYPGKGSTFILKIPINMATINGTIIEISGYRYIVPTLNIKQIFKPTADDWVKIKNETTCVKNRNQILTIIPIDKILGLEEKELMDRGTLMITLEYDNHLKAMPVTSVIGKQEVVIKPIGTDFQHLKFITGATILGDGGVSLILDVESIFL